MHHSQNVLSTSINVTICVLYHDPKCTELVPFLDDVSSITPYPNPKYTELAPFLNNTNSITSHPNAKSTELVLFLNNVNGVTSYHDPKYTQLVPFLFEYVLLVYCIHHANARVILWFPVFNFCLFQSNRLKCQILTAMKKKH